VVRYREETTKILGEAVFNPLNAELNSIRYLLALLGVHSILHVSRVRVNCATMSNNNVRNMQTCEVGVTTSLCCRVSLEKPLLTQSRNLLVVFEFA
jgi:hypothetical protein